MPPEPYDVRTSRRPLTPHPTHPNHLHRAALPCVCITSHCVAGQDPIEDPRFLDEYRAFYRSREEWNALVEAHGFVRVRWAEPYLCPIYLDLYLS